MKYISRAELRRLSIEIISNRHWEADPRLSEVTLYLILRKAIIQIFWRVYRVAERSLFRLDFRSQ